MEKIGFINSYMFPYDYCNGALDVNEGGPFRCYSDNNFPLYQDPAFPNNCDFIVNIEENELNSNLSVYPNPANSIINIKGLSKNKSGTYSIFNIDGKLWKTGELTDEINIEELRNGIYFIRISIESISQYFKFIISK